MVTTLIAHTLTVIALSIGDKSEIEARVNLIPFMLIDFVILYIVGVIYGVFPPIV